MTQPARATAIIQALLRLFNLCCAGVQRDYWHFVAGAFGVSVPVTGMGFPSMHEGAGR